jgi:ATP:corrinoid adenosyltransferase
VYRNTQSATILAWRNGSVSFVLIGKEEMSRLMDLAQAVSTVNKENHGFRE